MWNNYQVFAVNAIECTYGLMFIFIIHDPKLDCRMTLFNPCKRKSAPYPTKSISDVQAHLDNWLEVYFSIVCLFAFLTFSSIFKLLSQLFVNNQMSTFHLSVCKLSLTTPSFLFFFSIQNYWILHSPKSLALCWRYCKVVKACHLTKMHHYQLFQKSVQFHLY